MNSILQSLGGNVPDNAAPSKTKGEPSSATGLKRPVALLSLKGERSFRRVRQHGLTLRRPLFTLRVTDYRPLHRQPYRPAAVVGVVVSKKTLKRAVARNRLRRRTKEALRGIPLPPCRAVLMPNPTCLVVPFSELQAALAKAFAEAEQASFRPRVGSKRGASRSRS